MYVRVDSTCIYSAFHGDLDVCVHNARAPVNTHTGMLSTFGVGMETGHCKLLSGHTFISLQNFGSICLPLFHEGAVCKATKP